MVYAIPIVSDEFTGVYGHELIFHIFAGSKEMLCVFRNVDVISSVKMHSTVLISLRCSGGMRGRLL